jgi:hypothetical protein
MYLIIGQPFAIFSASSGQGAGRAVLLAAMQDHVKRGPETFYLIATAAGKPLYDRPRFETVDQLSVWLVGESSQFPAH